MGVVGTRLRDELRDAGSDRIGDDDCDAAYVFAVIVWVDTGRDFLAFCGVSVCSAFAEGGLMMTSQCTGEDGTGGRMLSEGGRRLWRVAGADCMRGASRSGITCGGTGSRSKVDLVALGGGPTAKLKLLFHAGADGGTLREGG